MCGRYALALRPDQVRYRLAESNMPSQEGPDVGDVRKTHNFAPGSFGLVYRAAGPDPTTSSRDDTVPDEHVGQHASPENSKGREEPLYKIQAMKWGLIPFWTKRSPDYGSMLRTINCRDDSLAQSGGMWHTMKQKKRCVVIAQGFFEWLKKDGGKTKVPHFVKRTDGQLMCFAGLWDNVRYEDAPDKLYTYTIITTSSNKQLGFLHDRMPVILDNGSDDMFKWLDSEHSEWSAELQSLLKPYKGTLECYPVNSEVGKVGHDSPSFIVPLDSAENKQNIANFFGNQKKQAQKQPTADERDVGHRGNSQLSVKVQHQHEDTRATVDQDQSHADGVGNLDVTENTAPQPIDKDELGSPRGEKRTASAASPPNTPVASPAKRTRPASSKKQRSATSNGTAPKQSPRNDGSRKITSFFGK